MMQPTTVLDAETAGSGHRLAGALFGVLWRMRRLPVVDGVDRGMLVVLGEAAHLGPVRASTLAAEIRLDLSTVSRHMRALEDRGFITRSADAADARAQVISVTDAGRAVLLAALDARAAALAPAVADWDDADVQTLQTLLERLAAGVAAPTATAAGLSPYDPDQPASDHINKHQPTLEASTKDVL